MNTRKNTFLVMSVGLLTALAASAAFGQSGQSASSGDPALHAAHQQHQQAGTQQAATDQTKVLVDQIAELRAQVARLEAALIQGHKQASQPMAPSAPMAPAQGMGMMDDAMEMGGMGAQPAATSGGMPMGGSPMGSGMGMEKMMGSGKMGQMPMASMLVSALPGFPGTSHLYHVGATGFFLDHPEHISLTTDQQMKLGELREKTLMEQATAQRKIEQAEQELWDLTGSDTPDASKIEAKVREVEKLRGDQRLAFIRAVGSAAQVLTDDQRKQLAGLLAPTQQQPQQPPPAQGGGMGGHM